MTDAAVAESEDEVLPVEAEAEAAETEETETGEEEVTQPSESSTEKESDSFQERINEVTKKYREEERARIAIEQEREQLRQENEQLRSQQTNLPTPDKTLQDFDYDEAKYSAYLMGFVQEHATRQASEAAQATESRERVADFRSRESQFSETVEDYYTVAHQAPISDQVAEALIASDKGPELAYYLGNNPEIAIKVSQLPPMQMAIELGRLQATALAAPEKETTKAPPPPPKLEGVETSARIDLRTKSGDDLSTDEWMARRNKQVWS